MVLNIFIFVNICELQLSFGKKIVESFTVTFYIVEGNGGLLDYFSKEITLFVKYFTYSVRSKEMH